MFKLALNLNFSDVSPWLESGYAFKKVYHRSNAVSFSVHDIRRHMMTICPSNGDDDNFDHLVKVVSTRFPFCKATAFPFVISKYPVERCIALI